MADKYLTSGEAAGMIHLSATDDSRGGDDMRETATIQITAFGETHEVKCFISEARVDTVGSVAVGRFPTGTKLHLTPLSLWKRDRGFHSVTGEKLRDLPGPTAAVIDGVEYIVSTTLYTHNRNQGRIVAWSDEFKDTDAIAKW